MSNDTYIATIACPESGFNFEAAREAIAALTLEQIEDGQAIDNLGPGFDFDPNDEWEAAAGLDDIREALLTALVTLENQEPVEVRGRPGAEPTFVVTVTAEEEEMSSERTEVDDIYLLECTESVFAALYEPLTTDIAVTAVS